MKWRFSATDKLAGDTSPGDLCWLTEVLAVFDSPNRPQPPNITLVIRKDEPFIVLSTGPDEIKVYHSGHGIGRISRAVRVRVLCDSEFIG